MDLRVPVLLALTAAPAVAGDWQPAAETRPAIQLAARQLPPSPVGVPPLADHGLPGMSPVPLPKPLSNGPLSPAPLPPNQFVPAPQQEQLPSPPLQQPPAYRPQYQPQQPPAPPVYHNPARPLPKSAPLGTTPFDQGQSMYDQEPPEEILPDYPQGSGPPPGTIGQTYQRRTRVVGDNKHPRTGIVEINVPYEVDVTAQGMKAKWTGKVWRLETETPLLPGVPHIYAIKATRTGPDGTRVSDVRWVRLIMGRIVELSF